MSAAMKSALFTLVFGVWFVSLSVIIWYRVKESNERLTAEIEQLSAQLSECERASKPRFLGINTLNKDLIGVLGDTALADLFTVVAVREAGWNLNSLNARNFNNLFGMRYVGQTHAIAQTSGGYAIYQTRNDCLQDLREWVYERGGGQPTLEQDLYEWLEQRGYCPNCKGYYEGLREIKTLMQTY